jgi:diadenosine tetraphosphate (Ap4A) HIT family hydrolase
MSTAIHRLVERCRTGEYSPLVTRLRSGWVVMAERQVTRGYCLLLPDPVVATLNDLAALPRAQFLAEMAQLGDALLRVTGAARINYAIFGNQEPALHAHVFPRYREEPESTRCLQPWALDWNVAPEFSQARFGELLAEICAALASGSATR